MPDDPNITRVLVDKFRAGDDGALNRLIEHTYERLQRLTHRMLRTYGGVRRWDETCDVHHNAQIRLQNALSKVELKSDLHFYRLAAVQIRRELLDLAERYQGPMGSAANHYSDSFGSAINRAADPASSLEDLWDWTDFQLKAEQLPPEQAEVFDLIWYHGKTIKEVAALIGVSERTVKRRWVKAREALD